MPRRNDINTILILGSGPIKIGQAAEFDYSGTQACKALRGVGYRVVLVNSNPATIMTDPEVADRTYVEPLTPSTIERVIAIEKPDALLPTLGGQTALNLAKELHDSGLLDRYQVELIGARYEAIHKGEDRQAFQEAMTNIGLRTPEGKMVSSLDDALEFVTDLGYPVIVRPSYTLGGSGGGVAYDETDFRRIVKQGLHDSPTSTVLVEKSIIGWKEYELEVMRDHNDTVVIICSIENIDPMGVHTGDSITVAPAQTLSDKEYQRLRDDSIAIIREIGVDTGGSNIQFAVNPEDGEVVVIEMNPRVSRSSALASKATGYPIAKIAALLAVGYQLDELPNDITKETKAAFEPSIDYVVTKLPRFAFEKFPTTSDDLGTQMHSVGEAMAIGRTFKESLLKGLRSLELDTRISVQEQSIEDLEKLLRPCPYRLFAVIELLRRGKSTQVLCQKTGIDPWFMAQLREIIDAEQEIAALPAPDNWSRQLWHEIKRIGFSDNALAGIVNKSPIELRSLRLEKDLTPVYKTVDTCAAEFEAYTPYHYSTYESEDEVSNSEAEKVVILGSGPNRIGQGVEFDYATVHAVWSLRNAGYETIMVNSNPETVSTDYDTADRLYFEPLTLEDVLNVLDREEPAGVLLQLGGQTPLKLARSLTDAGAPIWGTTAVAIHKAEDRDSFRNLCLELKIPQPRGGVADKPNKVQALAEEIGYPVMVRPSYVLGGRAMKVVRDEIELVRYLKEVYAELPENPTILVDAFIEGASEVDVDAISDGKETIVAGIMEHIEGAGIHSGDSACITPPVTLTKEIQARIVDYSIQLSNAIGVRGLINIQYVVRAQEVYIIEANPRASRTVPYLSKAIGHPLAKYAALIAAGHSLADVGLTEMPKPTHYSVKEAVLPFEKFTAVPPILGPEMRSTGESMGIDSDPHLAYWKAQLGAGIVLPQEGTIAIIEDPSRIGSLKDLSSECQRIGFKVIHGSKANLPNPKDYQLLIDTNHSEALRQALETGIPFTTTLEAAWWTVRAIHAANQTDTGVFALQDLSK